MGSHILTDNSFGDEVLASDVPVLVDFWAEWCGPCKTAAPILDQISEEYEGKIKIAKLDVDEYQELMLEYSVMSLPTFILFKGGEPVERLVGFQGKEKMLDKITPHLS